MSKATRFFFDKDSDSHWYKIPIELRAQWDEMTVDDIAYDDYEAQEKFERLFGEYRTGGGIDFSFTDPQKL